MTAIRLRRDSRSLARCFSIDDLRRLAYRRLPAPIFHYLDGGADDERALARNTNVFDEVALLPRCLVNVAAIDTRTRLLGRTIDVPFFLSPTGMSRLFHHEAEPAVARAAARLNTFYSLSTLGTTAIESIAAVNAGPKIFQMYVLKDRELTRELVERARASRYDALCLTIDTAVAGNRERDRITGMTMPPRFSLASLRSFASRPGWALRLLTHPNFSLANVEHRVDALGASTLSVIEYVNSQMDRTLTWRDLEWLAGAWGGPLIVKGVQSVPDARQAVQSGATALMLSNHGGRQQDGVLPPLSLVTRVREALGTGVELIVDGGVRRGSHVLKALALGANACSIGRPYLYGLAAGGEAGVDRALLLLRQELERSMALCGVPKIADVGPELVTGDLRSCPW